MKIHEVEDSIPLERITLDDEKVLYMTDILCRLTENFHQNPRGT